MNKASNSVDVEAIRAFVLVADLQSFTRAAEILETSQAAISFKVKRLETRLGCVLLERTPRKVQLTARGEAFMPAARDLMLAYERAMEMPEAQPARMLALGISDHVAGPDLPALLGRLGSYDPWLMLEVRIAPSRELIAAFDRGELDAAIVRRERGRRGGELLGVERFGWFAAPDWQARDGEPLRLATMAAPCGVREIAVRALDRAGVPWREVFVGGGVMAVSAAVSSGLAVAPLAQRVAPVGAVDVGARLGLPTLDAAEIMMHSRAKEPRTRETLRTLASAFKGS